MRIQNIAGNGSWQAVALAPHNSYTVNIQNTASVATSVRFTNSPTEVYTIKSGSDLQMPVRAERLQMEVMAASGTIEIFISQISY